MDHKLQDSYGDDIPVMTEDRFSNSNNGFQDNNKPCSVRIMSGNNNSRNSDEVPTINVDQILKGEANYTSVLDQSVRKNSIESDRAYREITKDIIEKTREQLVEHTKAKGPLRINLMDFIIRMLFLQFVFLMSILFFNQKLEISDSVINTYIVSMFVETLAGLLIMIRFAFDSKQEVELIKVLN